LDEAVVAYRRALELDPGFAAAAANLGAALRLQGKAAEAIAAYRRAVAANPNLAELHYNLGIALEDDGRREEAIAAYHRALAIAPDFAAAHNNLGQALRADGMLSEAIEHYRQVLSTAPDADTCNNLGNALIDQMRFDEAFEAFDRSLELDPESASGHSNRLFAMHYLPSVDAHELFAAHRAWAERHAARFASGAARARRAPDATRRLRIGYVSPDFRTHSVAYFIEPILECHDRDAFEICCYADVRHADATTRRLQRLADHWRDIVRMDDDRVCEQIRADGIDILVDLAGHTANNRLLVFARRAAPVQVTYLGYPDTTGLETMDYRLTDALADPPGESDRLHSETLVRLPGFLCYRPSPDAPAVGAPPTAASGHVMFASFNNCAKINDAVVQAWAEILRERGDARLLLKARSLADADTRQRLWRSFARHGIEAERVELLPPAATAHAHLALYRRADVALDPFPYNGATTTCEALWMGVPVVCLAGDRHAGRVGHSLLARAGLPELVAATTHEYVERAVALADDRNRLEALRSTLRERLLGSALTNARRFTADLEDSYRRMAERCS
ncbi:MAG: tetratricopeptide repeat protein, partial [Gammaproteobacteria bacterium]|nr:tetratricopeptide repeat protein [Gammaproteobacteria bacterium]